MGLFSKKECSICGMPSGVLSYRKLADGILCKECRARLSPFYDVTGKDTVAGITAQLEYRQRNYDELRRFLPTVTLGGAGKVFIDPQMGKFTVCREQELREGNPDLFDLAGLRSCTLEVREHYDRGDDNEPSRYNYNFYLRFAVDHPFIRNFTYGYSGITVTSSHRIKETEAQQIYFGQKDIKTGMSAFFSGVSRKTMEAYLSQYAMAQDMIGALTQAANAARSGFVNQPAAGQAYQPRAFGEPAPEEYYPQTVDQPPVYAQPAAPAYTQPAYQQPVNQQPASAAANFCPHCGTRVSGGAFCPSCGTRL